MFGISAGEFLVILLVATLVLGPKSVAQGIGVLKTGIRQFRDWSAKLREQTPIDATTLGVTPEDIAMIKSFNASDIDPRRLIQDAVHEEVQAWIAATSGPTTQNKPQGDPS